MSESVSFVSPTTWPSVLRVKRAVASAAVSGVFAALIAAAWLKSVAPSRFCGAKQRHAPIPSNANAIKRKDLFLDALR